MELPPKDTRRWSYHLTIMHPKTQEDGVTTRPIPQKKSEATNRLLEGASCSACTTQIRQGAQRLVCWSCKAQYHLRYMMSNRTQIVRTKTTQRWQCTHCSQKPIADSHDNQMVPVLDMTSPSVHQCNLRILQWNANGIHRELPFLEDLLEAANVDVVCIQETKLQPKYKTPELRNFSVVHSDRPVQGEASGGGIMISTRKQIPYKISHSQSNYSNAMEKLTVEIATPNTLAFIVSNWYLPPKNSHYLQRTGISLSEHQPGTKVHEVINADVNDHDAA